MDELLKALKDGEDTVSMLAIMRDKILDDEAISEHQGWDVLPEMMASPEHVIFNAAVYIETLKKRAER